MPPARFSHSNQGGIPPSVQSAALHLAFAVTATFSVYTAYVEFDEGGHLLPAENVLVPLLVSAATCCAGRWSWHSYATYIYSSLGLHMAYVQL